METIIVKDEKRAWVFEIITKKQQMKQRNSAYKFSPVPDTEIKEQGRKNREYALVKNVGALNDPINKEATRKEK